MFKSVPVPEDIIRFITHHHGEVDGVDEDASPDSGCLLVTAEALDVVIKPLEDRENLTARAILKLKETLGDCDILLLLPEIITNYDERES